MIYSRDEGVLSTGDQVGSALVADLYIVLRWRSSAGAGVFLSRILWVELYLISGEGDDERYKILRTVYNTRVVTTSGRFTSLPSESSAITRFFQLSRNQWQKWLCHWIVAAARYPPLCGTRVSEKGRGHIVR